MRVLVVGLGALGTVYSCLLSKAGHEVYGLAREKACAEIRSHGLRVEGIWGEHHAFLKSVVSHPAQLPASSWDLIIVTVKSFHNAEVLPQLGALIGPKTYVCLLQNGYGNYDIAIRFLPRENILLGRVIFGAEMIRTGVSKVTVCADHVILGSPENLVPNDELQLIADSFDQALIPTKFSDRIMEYIWAKIIYNSALNPLGALFGVSYGELAANEHTRAMMNEVIKEIFVLLAKMGQPTLWPDQESYYEAFYKQMIPVTAAHHASMLQDISRGRRTEIDALNGAVACLARKYGTEAPINEFLTRIIKAKETIRS